MNNTDIVKILGQIENGQRIILSEEEKEYLGDIFRKQGCCHLLSKVGINNEKEKEKNIKTTKTSYQIAKNVFEELEKNKIAYAVMKGAPLSKMAYGNMGYRKSRDIDLLCSDKDVRKVENIMFSLGYKQGKIDSNKFCPLDRKSILFYGFNTHQTAPIILETGRDDVPFVEFDLNKSIIWSESNNKIDVEEYLNHTIDLEVFSGIKVRTLSPLYSFIAMCLHHYKDMNSIYLLYRKKRISLRRFYDILYYLKENPDECSPEQLFIVANKYNVLKYCYYCIYYCYELFHCEFLVPYLQILFSPEAERLTRVYGLNELKQHEWNVELSDRIFNHNLDQMISSEVTEEEMKTVKANMEYM